MVSPTVSVITPTFNRAGLLPETIDSILSQSFQDFEYLIIDDGSTDDTRALVEAYGGRLSYFYHSNSGEAASTNRGWSHARGRYVAVVSSDDPMLPGWLERTVAFMEANSHILVCYPDWHIIDEQSRTITELKTYEYNLAHMVSWLHTIPGPGALIRREALTHLPRLRNPSYRFIPDLETWFNLGLIGPFARIPEALATWRQHAGSLTVANSSLLRAMEFPRLVKTFFRRGDLPSDIVPLRRYALSRAHWIAGWVLRDTHPFRAACHLRYSYALASENPPGLPRALHRLPQPSAREMLRLVIQPLRARLA